MRILKFEKRNLSNIIQKHLKSIYNSAFEMKTQHSSYFFGTGTAHNLKSSQIPSNINWQNSTFVKLVLFNRSLIFIRYFEFTEIYNCAVVSPRSFITHRNMPTTI